MTADLRVSAEGLAKKYCRSLKRTMLYGAADAARRIFTGGQRPDVLRRDEFWALRDVSFAVRRGECVGLIGPNGAGKSTILKVLNGIIAPDRGIVRVRGRVGALVEVGAGFHPMLTGRENIYINGQILGMSKKEIDAKFEQIVNFADIGDFLDMPVRYYSSGMFVRLGFAVAVHTEPDILLVDEVLAVGDTAFRMKCYQHFLNLRQKGATIILVSHSNLDITRVCDRVLVMNRGAKMYDGEPMAGIAAYENLLLRRRLEEEECSVGRSAWIKTVELASAGQRSKAALQTGDTLEGRVTIAALRPIKGARLVVHVNAPALGSIGSFSTSHANFSFDVVPSETVLRFKIKDMPLLLGTYSMTFHLYGPDIDDFFHTAEGVATFSIISPVDPFGYGLWGTLRFEHEWAMEPDPHCSHKLPRPMEGPPD